MKDIEIWISPELAETVSTGDTMTIVVSDVKKMGSGFLVSGKGIVISPTAVGVKVSRAISIESSENDHDKTADGDIAETNSFDLSGSAVSPTETEGEEKNEVEHESVSDLAGESVPAISFGERGPQLINGEETPEDMGEVEEAEKAPQEVAKRSPSRKTVESIQELYEELSKNADLESEVEQDMSNISPDMRREMAVKLEREGKIGCGVDAWIRNKSGGQLHLSDIDITIRHGDAFNLGRVSPRKLLASTDLFESVSAGLIEFIDSESAVKMNIATERRLADLEERIGGIDVYDNSDDIYDSINDSDFEEAFDDDPYPRMDARANVRKAVNVDDRFRRGIRQAGKKDGSDRAAVEAPQRFRGMEPQNVLAEDKYEFDEIFEGIESRESEISDGSEVDWMGDMESAPVRKSSRSHVSVKRK